MPRTVRATGSADSMRLRELFNIERTSEDAHQVETWNEADSFPSGSVVEYIGPNIEVGTLLVIIRVKCIGEETRQPIYWVDFFNNRERYRYGVHHAYLKASNKQARINWEV